MKQFAQAIVTLHVECGIQPEEITDHLTDPVRSVIFFSKDAPTIAADLHLSVLDVFRGELKFRTEPDDPRI